MHLFRDMPIKQKLLGIIMSVTAAALLLSGLGIVIADSVLFRYAAGHFRLSPDCRRQ
jgi:hypothetical protein